MGSKLINTLQKEMKKDYFNQMWSGSFCDFLNLVEKDPRLGTRTAFQYLDDMINYFGHKEIIDCGEKIKRYNLFDDPITFGNHAVYGIDRELQNLVNNISSVAKRGADERIILLYGPPGTGKTSIIQLFIKGLEEYSKTQDGALYTFDWVFPQEGNKNSIGFNSVKDVNKKIESFANLPDSELYCRIPCQINDHPLILLPRDKRRRFLENIVSQSDSKILIPDKLLEDELCSNCSTIRNRLLEKYDGDILKVLNHVKIIRLNVSQMSGIGAATSESGQNKDAQSPLIVREDSDYQKISSVMPGIRLHQFMGKMADANRGIIEYSELFDRHPQELLHLLSAAEEHRVDFNGQQAYVDLAIFGTTNLVQFEKMKSSMDMIHLFSRINASPICHVLKVSEEKNIYQKLIRKSGYSHDPKHAKENHHIMPYSLDMLSLWAVCTRLFPPKKEFYKKNNYDFKKKQIDFIDRISPVLKAKLYDHSNQKISGFNRTRLDLVTESEFLRALRKEYEGVEGLFGADPRSLENLVSKTISAKKESNNKMCLNPYDFFEQIQNLLFENNSHFLKVIPEIEDESLYFNFKELLEEVKMEYELKMEADVEKAIVGMDSSTIREKIDEYFVLVKKWANNEKDYDSVTGKYVEPSEEKMEWFEKLLLVPSEKTKEHRDQLMLDFGRSKVDGKSRNKIYTEYYESFQQGLFFEKIRNDWDFKKIKKGLEAFNSPSFKKLDIEIKNRVEELVKNMISLNYCDICAKETLLWTFQNILEPLYNPEVI